MDKAIGDVQELQKLLAVNKSDGTSTPVTSTEVIIQHLNEHTWQITSWIGFDKLHFQPDEVIDAVLAAATPEVRESLRSHTMHVAKGMPRSNPRWLALVVRLIDSPPFEGSGRDLMSLVSGFAWLEPARPSLARLSRGCNDSIRHEAWWEYATDHNRLRAGLNNTVVGILLDGLEGTWNGRHPVHAAALAADAAALQSFPNAMDEALGETIARFTTWHFGPDGNGDRYIKTVELPKGATPAALVRQLLDVLRTGRDALSQPFEPKAKLKRWIKERKLDTKLEEIERSRAAELEAVNERIKRYEDALAVIERSDSSSEASVRTEPEDGPADAPVDLPWLREHLEDCADDAIDAPVEFTRAYARGADVCVEFEVEGEARRVEIAWPQPSESGDDEILDGKILELINEIADHAH